MLGNRGQKGWLRLQVLPCRPGPGCQAGQEGPVQGHPQGSPEHIGPEEKGGATVYSSWPSPSSGSTENMRQRDRGAVARVRDAFPLSSALRVWSPLQGQGQTLLPQPLLSAAPSPSSGMKLVTKTLQAASLSLLKSVFLVSLHCHSSHSWDHGDSLHLPPGWPPYSQHEIQARSCPFPAKIL